MVYLSVYSFLIGTPCHFQGSSLAHLLMDLYLDNMAFLAIIIGNFTFHPPVVHCLTCRSGSFTNNIISAVEGKSRSRKTNLEGGLRWLGKVAAVVVLRRNQTECKASKIF